MWYYGSMKNLAGVPTCDQDIRIELATAGIPAVVTGKTRSEVPYTVTGHLGVFDFRRAWYYWCVSGPVPLEVAKELYADPAGEKDVRVVGHCGCPPPEAPWLTWRDEDGKELVPQNQYSEYCALFKDKADEFIKEQNIRFSDDPTRDGKAFVENYHIDTQEGLNLFAATLKKFKLV